MITKALLLVGASVVAGQLACYSQPLTNCTTAQGSGLTCAPTTGSCYRAIGPNVTACSTAAMTCAGGSCATGTAIMDGTTCSTCADQCSTFSSNATCSVAPSCAWLAPLCGPAAAMMTLPCSATTSATCTALDNCFWLSVTTKNCGAAASTYSVCTPCNGTFSSVATRSALHNNVGKTCTWAQVSPFTYSFSLTINAASESATTCAAFTAPDPVADPAALTVASQTQLFGNPVPFTGAPTVTCTTPSSGADALIPSLALLGVFAALA